MREALDWVARLHSQEMDVAQAEALARWRNSNPAHEQAFQQASRRWNLFRSAALNVAARGGLKETPPASGRAVPLIARRAMLGGALAASAAGAAYLAARPPFGLWPSVNELVADYRTRTGHTRQLKLADTVSVEMNTQTSLSTRSARSEVAAIELISGEVAVAAKSPVVVFAGGGQARASEGVFDLRCDAGGAVSVACLEGEVQVACGHEATLKAGQQVVYDGSGLGGVAKVDAGRIGAWRKGLLIFEDAPLSVVIAEINRYRTGWIVLMNPALGSLPVEATFRLDTIGEAASRLADVFELKTRSLPGGIVLLG